MQCYKCKICWQFFLEPVTLPCGHTYCQECVPSNKKCPIHCEYETRNLELKVNLTIKEALEQVEIECEFCSAKCLHGVYREHLAKTCEQNKDKCIYCNAELPVKDLLVHQQECPKKVVCSRCGKNTGKDGKCLDKKCGSLIINGVNLSILNNNEFVEKITMFVVNKLISEEQFIQFLLDRSNGVVTTHIEINTVNDMSRVEQNTENNRIMYNPNREFWNFLGDMLLYGLLSLVFTYLIHLGLRSSIKDILFLPIAISASVLSGGVFYITDFMKDPKILFMQKCFTFTLYCIFTTLSLVLLLG